MIGYCTTLVSRARTEYTCCNRLRNYSFHCLTIIGVNSRNLRIKSRKRYALATALSRNKSCPRRCSSLCLTTLHHCRNVQDQNWSVPQHILKGSFPQLTSLRFRKSTLPVPESWETRREQLKSKSVVKQLLQDSFYEIIIVLINLGVVTRAKVTEISQFLMAEIHKKHWRESCRHCPRHLLGRSTINQLRLECRT